MTLPIQDSLDSAYIPYIASKDARDLIAHMGRTEDLKFSPDSRWMAIAGFGKNRIYLFAVKIISRKGIKTIEIGQLPRFVLLACQNLMALHFSVRST